jgi:ubiquinol-cytochrome c reductase cytochrome b subunit
LLRFFVDGVYKAPRELFWVFGAVLLLVAANEALTGTLLPWDQESYWTVTRGLEVVATLPVAGSVMSFLVGGFDVLSGTLLRFYVLHIIFIPLVMVFFFYLHFATVRKVGLSPLPEERRAEARPLYPDHLLQLMILSLLLFGAILTLGALFPAPFSAKADPFLSPPGAHPPWYLLPAFGLVDLLPHWFGGLLIVAACAALVFLPFIERSPHRESGRRRFFAGTAAAFCLVVIILAYIGYRRAV